MLREGVGTLRLQTIPLLIIPTVTRLCRQFKQANPGCDFEFSTGMSSQVCQSVIQGKADIGFCSKILPDPQLVYAAIQRRAMVAAVPLDHPLARQDTVTLEETLPLPPRDLFLAQRAARPGRPPLCSRPGPVAHRLPGGGRQLHFGAGGQGFGITVLLDTPPVHRPDVKVLPLTHPVQESDFYIVRRSAPHPMGSVERFFDFCVAESQKETDPSL